MTQVSDTEFTVEYGRVESSKATARYPMSKWSSIKRSKIRKGYRDITGLKTVSVVEKTVSKNIDLGDARVNTFMDFLQSSALHSIGSNYSVTYHDVTLQQVNEAQKQLDILADMASTDGGLNINLFNDALIELYMIIPRRMTNVRNHLASNKSEALVKISSEQDTLDSMKGQVTMNAPKENIVEAESILDKMGIAISPVEDTDELDRIFSMNNYDGVKIHNVFKITNHNTQKIFDAAVGSSNNKTTKLLWHGSRNENWISILQSGLLLRPSNAIITGKMFGYGTYFAPSFGKSVGYTSLKGSYWTSGNANKGVMALYDVHYGNPYIVYSSQPGMTYDKLRKYGEYDSVHAKAGRVLRNDEIIVYREPQTTISYMVEISR